MEKITIAIDGPCYSGKGTTAKQVADRLGYQFLDTGMMYRAIAWWMVNNSIGIEDMAGIESELQKIDITFDDQGMMCLNGTCMGEKIKTPNIALAATTYAPIPMIRSFLVTQQQKTIQGGGWTIDGRDAGSVIAPDAELKIYLDCDIEIRAKRRAKELGVTEPDGIEEIQNKIALRDEQDMDSVRGAAQLRILPDSIVIDTTNLTINEQVQRVTQLARQRIQAKQATVTTTKKS